MREWFGPDLHRPPAALFGEHHLPVLEPERDQITVVGEVEETTPRTVLDLAGQVRQQVEPVDVNLVLNVSDLVALLQLLADVGVARSSEQGGQPVMVLDDLVGYAACGDSPWPA